MRVRSFFLLYLFFTIHWLVVALPLDNKYIRVVRRCCRYIVLYYYIVDGAFENARSIRRNKRFIYSDYGFPRETRRYIFLYCYYYYSVYLRYANFITTNWVGARYNVVIKWTVRARFSRTMVISNILRWRRCSDGKLQQSYSFPQDAYTHPHTRHNYVAYALLKWGNSAYGDEARSAAICVYDLPPSIGIRRNEVYKNNNITIKYISHL